MKRAGLLLLPLLCTYGVLIGPFATRMHERPYVEKLGYVPEAPVLRIAAADQKALAAAVLIFKAMMYYGGIPETSKTQRAFAPDFSGMERTFSTATRLDPYNMDAYYFGQATLVWDLRHFAEANALLSYGMEYRTWDFYLPMFAGFNSAYFMKDYESAARYYRRAGEISGSDLFMNLTSRYLFETGQTEQAIAYLTMMVQGAGNDAIRKGLETRLSAFQALREIEKARDRFKQQQLREPMTVEELLEFGALSKIPQDPYGGKFFLTEDGQVRSTSKFAGGVATPKDKK